MKACSAAGAAVAAILAATADAQVYEFRWVERHGQTTVPAGAVVAPDGPTVAGHTDSDATILLYLEARVIGGGALGIGEFEGDVVTNEPYFGGGGAFLGMPSTQPVPTAGTIVNAARASSAYAPSYKGYVNGDGEPLPTGRAVFNPFRLLADYGDTAQGVLNDADPGWDGLQAPAFRGAYRFKGHSRQAEYDANVVDGSEFGLGEFVPILTVRYDLASLTPRTINFTFNGQIRGFTEFTNSLPTGLPFVPFSATYSVQIIPAPGSAALLVLGGLAAARRSRRA